MHTHCQADAFSTQYTQLNQIHTPIGRVIETVHQQAGAAAALLLSPCEALANEFDVLNEAKPSSNYIIDDANVLNKTTRKTVNDQLSRLEVGFQGPFCCMLVPACLRADLSAA